MLVRRTRRTGGRHVEAKEGFLSHYEAAIAAYEQAGRPLSLPPGAATASPFTVVPPPIPPTGFEAAPPGDRDAAGALVGRTVLYRGTGTRLCPRGAFSHMVAWYPRQTWALRGSRCTTLPPTAPAGPGGCFLGSRRPAAGR